MVKYLASTASTTIQVLTAEVGTTLSINAPANVTQGQPFDIFGVLQRIDNMQTLDGETIELWVDGVFISSMLTDWVGTPVGPSPGAYQFFHSISAEGVHTLEVFFRGVTGALGASSAQASVGVGAQAIPPALMVSGGAVLLGTLAVIVSAKK